MAAVIRTVPQKTMLREVAAYHAQGYNWVPASCLSTGSGREYDCARTAAALVRAGMLEQGAAGSQYAYRATPAGIAWVDADQELDSLGRRKGYRRTAVPPEVMARARQLLAERDEGGRRKHTIQEVAGIVGLSRHTLSMQLHPKRHKRYLEQRRQAYNNQRQKT